MNKIQYLIHLCPKYIYTSFQRDYYYIYTNSQSLVQIASIFHLHINFQYKQLMDLAGVDYPSNRFRFQLVYNFLSTTYSNRLFLKLNNDEVSSVPSLLFNFPSVSWYERECWDLFGVHFTNNSDLRRILTDYGFIGHPLRKDFPMSGFTEVVFSEKRKNIVYKPVSLIQDFRVFDTLMPWNYYWQFENVR